MPEVVNFCSSDSPNSTCVGGKECDVAVMLDEVSLSGRTNQDS